MTDKANQRTYDMEWVSAVLTALPKHRRSFLQRRIEEAFRESVPAMVDRIGAGLSPHALVAAMEDVVMAWEQRVLDAAWGKPSQ